MDQPPVLPTMDMEAVVIITEAPRVSRDMAMDTIEREMLSQDMAMVVMDMEDMDQPLSVFPSPTMDMDIQLPTPMVMTLPMDMARDQLRLRLNQVMDMLPATLTDLLRVSLDMEDMVMEVTM